jgi:chemotaxis signal transduction protein
MLEPIITFEARSEWFGLMAREVREVARLRAVRVVPRAPEVIAGLAEVHGRVVTLIDLLRLLPERDGGPGGPDVPDALGGDEFGVVLAAPHDHLGILVRSEVDVVALPEEAEPAAAGSAIWLRGRLSIGERLLNLLSLPALVGRVEETIRQGFRPGPQGEVEEEG